MGPCPPIAKAAPSSQAAVLSCSDHHQMFCVAFVLVDGHAKRLAKEQSDRAMVPRLSWTGSPQLNRCPLACHQTACWETDLIYQSPMQIAVIKPFFLGSLTRRLYHSFSRGDHEVSSLQIAGFMEYKVVMMSCWCSSR